MPRYAANLSTMWPELETFERFHAAADAGFEHVEYLFPHLLDVSRLRSVLASTGLRLVLFDLDPGDIDAGERGLMCLPGREAEFKRSVTKGIALAQDLGVDRVNALAGVRPDQVDERAAASVAEKNLHWAAAAAEAAGITFVIEAINPIDRPGYFLPTTSSAAALVESISSPSIRLQLDAYHAFVMGDAREDLREYRHLIEHVQIADHPGRHQPGTGRAPIGDVLVELDRSGYLGFVGLEYVPLGSTEDSLSWLPPAARGHVPSRTAPGPTAAPSVSSARCSRVP